MPAEKPTSLRFHAVVAVGSALIVAGSVWWLLLLTMGGQGETVVASGQRATAPLDPAERTEAHVIEPTRVPARETAEPPAVAPIGGSAPLSFGAPLRYDTAMGTRSAEFSAVTLNEGTNRLVVADDEGWLFEFDLSQDGKPVVPARRAIKVEVGDSDIEGLAWMTGTTYVLAHEADGVLSIVDIGDDLLVIEDEHRLRSIETGIVETAGSGIEGVTVSQRADSAFVVVVEQPPSLRFIADDGAAEQVVPLQIGLADVSDVWAAPDGTIWVVSHEDAVIVHLDIGNDGTIVERQRIDLVFADGRFPQAEGVVMSRDGSRLYVVGEGAAPRQFTFAFWSVEPR